MSCLRVPSFMLATGTALCLASLGVHAQQSAPAAPAAREAPPPEELEPAVDTTKSAPAEGAAQEPKPAPAAPEEARSGAKTRAAATAAPAAAQPAKPAARKGPDRLQLDTTDITGNRELPKVLYIVPWKHSDLGDLSGKPVNSLLDEVLQPLDRDVFRRENRYYDALKPDQAGPKADPVQGSRDKP